ncbi:acetoin utilization protein AcuC [Anaerolineales bacterium HSG6]|nr:acetoin utilization protein AcuC [Anaerolineales bacterium HSG6]
MKRTAIIGDKILWADGHPPGHPLRPERLQNTWDMLQAYNAFTATNVQVVPPRFPSQTELTSFHTKNYVNAVRHLSQGEKNVNPARYGFGQGDNPVFAGMFESEALKVGGGLIGTELLLNNEADVVFNFAGGLHHAGKAHASGFCVFGDAAIAIHKMLDAGKRVAYIDIDAHHGDGVQNAFYDDPRVLTISFHESGLYLFPGTGFEHEIGTGDGEGYSVNVPLLPYTDDKAFVWAFDQIVPPLLERFEPDVVVAQLGLDAHWNDPLTHLSLTTHGLESLFQRIHDLSPRWLAVGGGGYEQTVVPRGWTLAWGVMSGQQFADELPPSVANDHSLPLLHDAEPAPLSDMQRKQARNGAEEVVGRLKKLLALDD